MRDAAIQRFEYNYELAWKTAKVFLNEMYGIAINSPKEVFRKLLSQSLLSEVETELTLNMVVDRNNLTHTYNEDFAIALAKKIPEYYRVLNRILEVVDKD